MNRRRFLLILLVLVVVGASTAWVLRPQILPGVARWLDVGTLPRHVDCVFILPGDEQVRPFVAAALVNAGFADVALFPENLPSPEELEGIRLPTSEIIRRVLDYRGLSEAQMISLKANTETSAQDLHALRSYLQTHPGIEVAVVTSNYHTRRVRWLAWRLLGDDARRLCYVSAPVDDFSTDDWWRTPVGFTTIASEYLKLAFTATQSPGVRWSAVGLLMAVAGGAVVVARRRRLVIADRAVTGVSTNSETP